jgi:preprotein translocase subunit SecD
MLIYFGGFTLNLMTLGGLALGVGMLVDNSIVVLENIYRLRETTLIRTRCGGGAGEPRKWRPPLRHTLTTCGGSSP